MRARAKEYRSSRDLRNGMYGRRDQSLILNRCSLRAGETDFTDKSYTYRMPLARMKRAFMSTR